MKTPAGVLEACAQEKSWMQLALHSYQGRLQACLLGLAQAGHSALYTGGLAG